MTYRSRNSKLTKDGSEIIMESIRFRLQYDKSFIINERYLPRRLKIYNNNHINTITNTNNYMNRYPREDSFYNNSKNPYSDPNNFTFYKQPLNKFSPRKSNQNLPVTAEYYLPSSRSKGSKYRPTETSKDSHVRLELPSINDASKNYFQNTKKKTSKMRLRNLLDSGSECDFKASSTEKLNAYVIPENFQDRLIYMSEKAYEKQLKQIDSYKDFKSKLGYSFSRRQPLASLHTSPNFMVLPISRYNQEANLDINPERGRTYEHTSDTELDNDINLYDPENYHVNERVPEEFLSNMDKEVLKSIGDSFKEKKKDSEDDIKRFGLEKLQVYGPEVSRPKSGKIETIEIELKIMEESYRAANHKNNDETEVIESVEENYENDQKILEKLEKSFAENSEINNSELDRDNNNQAYVKEDDNSDHELEKIDEENQHDESNEIEN